MVDAQTDTVDWSNGVLCRRRRKKPGWDRL